MFFIFILPEDRVTLESKPDEQLNKTEKLLNKTIKKLDAVGRQLGDIGLVQGEVAEDLFYRNVQGSPKNNFTF